MTGHRRHLVRWLIWIPLVLAVCLVGAYVHLTDPQRLRARALAVLAGLPFERVDVAHVTYSARSGLILSDLTLGSVDSQSEAPLPPLLHVSEARVQCDWRGLLGGRIEPRLIELLGGTLTVVCRPTGDADAWTFSPADFEAGTWQRLGDLLSGVLPQVVIRSADLQLVMMHGGEARLFERIRVEGTGAHSDDGYALRFYRLPVGPHPLAELVWRRHAQAIDFSMDWVPLRTVGEVVSERVAGACERVGLAGRVRVERMTYSLTDTPGAQLTAADLRIDGLGAALPVEEDPPGGPARPARDHFLQLTDTSVTATYRRNEPAAPGRLRVQAMGRLNGAPLAARLTTKADVVARALLAAGAGETPPDGARLRMEDLLNGELQLAGVELPTVATAPDFLGAPRLPGPVRAAFKDYQPAGRVDLTIRVLPEQERGGRRGIDRVEMVIRSLECSCMYRHFPYPFERVTGELRFEQGGTRFEDLRAWHGASAVRARGRLNSTHHWTGLEVEIQGRNVALAQDLYAALPDSYRALWREAAPLGVCDVVTRVRRAEGSAESGPCPPEIEVDARLLAGSLTLAGVRRVDHADAELSIQGGVIEVHDLHGFDGEASVRLSGRIPTQAGAGEAELRVEVGQMPVEQIVPVKFGEADRPQQIAFQGRANAWGRLYGGAAGDPRQRHMALQVTEGRLIGFQADREWTDCRGWIVDRDAEQRVLSFECRQGAATLRGSGRLPRAGEVEATLALELHAGVPAIDELLPQFVPERWLASAETLGLAGPGSVAVTLQHDPAAPGVAEGARIRLQAEQMQAAPLPLALRDVAAEVQVSAGRFSVEQSQARWGEAGEIEARAAGTWTNEDFEVQMEVAARNLTFTPELVEALPQPLKRLLQRLAAAGGFDVFLSQVRVVGAEERLWEFTGRVPLREAALRVGLELTDLEGLLFGTCTLLPDGSVSLRAEIEVDAAQLAGRSLRDWSGQVRWLPGERWVEFKDLHGQLGDGRAVGYVRIDPDTSDYELELTLDGVSVHELFPPPEETAAVPRRGRLDGKIHLMGRGADTASRRGRGDLRIYGGSFLGSPVLASVAEAGTPAQGPISDRVDQADIRFLWEGMTLKLLRVEIQSADLRLLGTGAWHLGDDGIELTLVGAHPRHWPRVAVLTDVVESVNRTLVKYEVRGTLAKPEVSAKPLYELDEALQALLFAE